MQGNQWLLALGLCLLAVVSAKAEVIKGVMAVTGAEMD
jgi:hypothetical protein